ncbi:MAG: glutathione-disulfide reductase [Deltaproteobacteria bacterium]|nr:glutathione-disulfide reductase [Deltaproteobacteria bacterium]
MSYDYDLLTIGAGSGGVRASRMASSYGARVAVVEERYLGGTCVNVGCVPKKLLVYAAQFSQAFSDAHGFGWQGTPAQFDWATLIANKNAEIERLNGVYQRLLTNAGVEIIDGHGELLDAHRVRIGQRVVSADKILIATGGWPVIPDAPGSQHVISSNEAFFLTELPRRVTVVGGGYIGVEFAGIFSGLGAQTTLIYRGPLFMRGFDDDLRTTLAESMRGRGVDLRFNTTVGAIEKRADGLHCTLSDGSKLITDQVLCAIGRRPRIDGLGLEQVGVQTRESGAIIVDDRFRTSVDNIYALGDVTDRVQLTPVALAEGMALASNLFRGTNHGVDYQNIPSAVFSQPNLGTVGLTEQQARERFEKIRVYRSKFRAMKHTLSGRDEQTLLKLVVDDATDRVIGCHMVGDDAGEIIQGLAVAIKCGATKAQFDATVGIHPTTAEEFVTMRTPVAD